MDAATVEELHAEYLAAQIRNAQLTARYNSEYRAGKWTTNREMAGRCEDAYSEEYRAMRAWEAARDAAEDEAPLDCPHEFVPALADRCGRCGESEHRISVGSRDYGALGSLRFAACSCGWTTKEVWNSIALDTLIRVHRG